MAYWNWCAAWRRRGRGALRRGRWVRWQASPTSTPNFASAFNAVVVSILTGTLIGYARVSTDAQDVAAQAIALTQFGVAPERIYVDRGRSGTDRDRPGRGKALAACRAGDTLVVTKLDRLARSIPDARDIATELADGASD